MLASAADCRRARVLSSVMRPGRASAGIQLAPRAKTGRPLTWSAKLRPVASGSETRRMSRSATGKVRRSSPQSTVEVVDRLAPMPAGHQSAGSAMSRSGLDEVASPWPLGLAGDGRRRRARRATGPGRRRGRGARRRRETLTAPAAVVLLDRRGRGSRPRRRRGRCGRGCRPGRGRCPSPSRSRTAACAACCRSGSGSCRRCRAPGRAGAAGEGVGLGGRRAQGDLDAVLAGHERRRRRRSRERAEGRLPRRRPRVPFRRISAMVSRQSATKVAGPSPGCAKVRERVQSRSATQRTAYSLRPW